jgi:hypothetical protein
MRCIVLALILFLTSNQPARAQAAEPEREGAPADEVSVVGPAIKSIQQSVEAIAENTNPANYADPPEQARDITPLQISILDLDAQRQMADYAESTFKAIVGDIIVGALTLGALIITILQTSKLVKQDRAWMASIKQEDPTIVGDPADPDVVVQVFSITNVGKTPAIKARSGIGGIPSSADSETH